jgi:hypothetical protein
MVLTAQVINGWFDERRQTCRVKRQVGDIRRMRLEEEVQTVEKPQKASKQARSARS